MPDDIKEQYNYYDRQEKRFNRLYRGSIANTNRKEYKEKRMDYKTRKNELAKSIKNDKINIEIDELTPCLIKDGKIINTTISRVNDPNVLMSKKDCWKFNWKKEYKDNKNGIFILKSNDNINRIQGQISIKPESNIKAIYVRLIENNPDNIQNGTYKGVGGHLFAYSCKLSKDMGYDGVVYFKPKYNARDGYKLIKHYKETLGAVEIGNGQLAIFEEEAERLIERYYGK